MQSPSPNVGLTLEAPAEKRAVPPVVNPQAVVRVARAVRVVASATAGRRRGATVTGFCNRGVRGVPGISPVRASSPNPAFEPTAASGVGSIPR